MLLGLDSLMQSVTPATTFHDTASLLVDNLYFAINNHVFIVLIEHAVSFQQLLQGVNTLRLYGIVLQQLVLLVHALFVRQIGLTFKS